MKHFLISLLIVASLSGCITTKTAFILRGEDFVCTTFPIDVDLFVSPRHCFNEKTNTDAAFLIQDGDENVLGRIVSVYLPMAQNDHDIVVLGPGNVRDDFVVLRTSFKIDPKMVFDVGVIPDQSVVYVVDESGNSTEAKLEMLHGDMLFIDYIGKQGMSGRPVLNKEGKVVGMLVGISDDISIITRMSTDKSDFILHVKSLNNQE